MSVSSTPSTNYTGRKKDISILQYPDSTLLDAQDVLPAFGKSGRFCAGVQKLVQRYAIILLTNTTSQDNYPAFGTSFLYTLQAGISPVDKLRASQIFSLANYQAISILRAYQATKRDIPTDERISNAELTDISMYGGYVSFDVSLTTESGSTIDFIVPLPK
jgi:hypothetical protein